MNAETQIVAAEANPLDDYASMLQEKILFGLSVYPFLSPSMLHVFLGTATSTHVWKPLLNELIADGKICKEEVPLTSPHDRSQTYTILRLTTNAYTPPTSANTGAND